MSRRARTIVLRRLGHGALVSLTLRGYRGSTRQLLGPVGQAIMPNIGEDRVLLLRDARPRTTNGLLVLTGVPGGITLTRCGGWTTDTKVEFVGMCEYFRDRIVGGEGRVRYGTVRAA